MTWPSKTDSVLVVVDMQTCFLRTYRDQDYVRDRIGAVNRAIQEARSRDIPVVFVEHEYVGALRQLVLRLFFKGLGTRAAADFPTDRRIQKSGADPLFTKTTGDSFSVRALAERLRKDGVRNVLLAGQDGDHCIPATARGGRRLGFNVIIIAPAIAAQDDGKWQLEKAALESAGVQIASL